MTKSDGQNAKKLHPLLKAGIIIFVIGSGPLLVIGGLSEIGIGDPNPNPVLLGIMAMYTFWPSIALIIIGIILTITKKP